MTKGTNLLLYRPFLRCNFHKNGIMVDKVKRAQ